MYLWYFEGRLKEFIDEVDVGYKRRIDNDLKIRRESIE
jgi:hypothetical protein